MVSGPTREAKSLYRHGHEDEIRLRLQIMNLIETNWQFSTDAQAKERAITQEERRQEMATKIRCQEQSSCVKPTLRLGASHSRKKFYRKCRWLVLGALLQALVE